VDLNTPLDTSPAALVAGLADLLDIEEIDTDLYRGARQPGGEGRVFGGQVIAQALQAAQRSTDAAKVAHSLHAYFMRAGAEDHPIVYRVVRDFDGKSFATRRVIALQHGQPILNLAASFQVPEEGLSHQDAMPEVPGPDKVRPDRETRATMVDDVPERFRRHLLRPRPIETRSVVSRGLVSPPPAEPRQAIWFRAVSPLPDDPALHRAVLAYASDMGLLGTAMMPHGVSWMNPALQSASLDHALWLHEPFRADEWLLYTTDSPWAGHARGFNRGSIFSADGRLVASTAQEGLVRVRR